MTAPFFLAEACLRGLDGPRARRQIVIGTDLVHTTPTAEPEGAV